MAIKTAKTNIRMTEELLQRYRSEAERLGITQSSLMTMALNEYFVQKDLTQTIVDMVQTQIAKKEK
jgi:antitoxin component of RelBE/YafQ-DinJ toxin-antitoxin module